MVAGEPPATNIKEHRGNGVGAMQVIADPEKIALTFPPGDGKRFISIEGSQDISVVCNH
jgi:hypothetical protein